MSTLDRETLRKIRRIRLHTRLILESGIVGSYHAAFKGRGMEFAELREYQPGDDIRTIDWNVTARSGVPHVKKYIEERDLTLLLLVDISGSSSFGSRYLAKRDLAAELSGVLAFSAVANKDRVGAVLFSDEVEMFIPPLRGEMHALRIVRDTLVHQARSKGTSIQKAVRFARGILKRRSIVALISDFQDHGYEKTLAALRRKHDVFALHLRDPLETSIPDIGLVRLTDPETGEVVVLDTNDPRVRAALMPPNAEEIRTGLRQCGVDSLPLTTSEPYDRPLQGFFKGRERRR
ncbi:MAG: DUF58 domain-containing protein [Vicinamibacteria bacterium]|nr:DUF58 domain-containing protein [Vicinamibacteria bacterium]